MRRTRLLTYLIALITLLTGVLVFASPGAGADTADLEIESEAWYGRAKDEDPQVNTCVPNPVTGEPTPVLPSTPRGCGPTSPADFPAPQAKSTGHYVIAARSGDLGDSDRQGDLAWAAFRWDVFDYFGATAEKFVVTLHLGMDNCSGSTCFNNGDTYQGQAGQTPPPIQACNVLEGWFGEPGANPWTAKPKASADCLVPTWNPNNKREATFDVTRFADSWLAGTGHGFVIRPGTPEVRTIRDPFQITFSGYYDPGTNTGSGCTAFPPGTPGTPTPTTAVGACTTTHNAPPPKVTFAFTPAAEDEFEDFDDFGSDEEIFEELEVGDESLEAAEDLDVIPTDVGSDEIPEDAGLLDTAAPVEELAAPTARPRTRPISNTPFPWLILLLLPLAAVAFWGTGTALGPMGDPMAVRRGGVSRVLAERQAAHRGSEFETRNR